MSSVQINLLPDLVLKRRHEAKVKQWALSGLIAWVALVLVVVLGTYGYSAFQSQRLKSAKNEVARLDTTVNSDENVAFRKEAQEVQASLVALDSLYNNQIRNSAILAQLALLTPKTVKLVNVSISDTAAISLGGTATSYEEVGKMIASFKESEKYGKDKGVNFNNIVFNGSSLSGTTAKFSMTMAYIYPIDTSEVNK